MQVYTETKQYTLFLMKSQIASVRTWARIPKDSKNPLRELLI